MLHARELLDRGVLFHGHGPEPGDAAQVVAREIHEHVVLGHLLGIPAQLRGQSHVLIGILVPGTRARDRHDLRPARDHRDEALGEEPTRVKPSASKKNMCGEGFVRRSTR